MVLASQVSAFEKLAHKFVTQGGGSYNGSHREPMVPGKISDAEYGKLSYSERIAYAARFPQPGG
jgi:phosphoketolase